MGVCESKSTESEGLLSPYRVLDLSDEKGQLCGRMLGDMGADVIIIEPVQGSSARRIGPFYYDIPDSEKSLFWFALNSNKRGITLSLKTINGRELFKKLVKTADFVIESSHPDYMNDIGLGYEALSQVNSQLIMTSITPFGPQGPYRDYKAADIVIMAMGGLSYISGEPTQAPLRIPVPQSYLHAGAWAAAASMIAFHHRQITGEGQHVHISMEEAATWATYVAQEWWSYAQRNLKREGTWRQIGLGRMQMIYPCQDGYVMVFILGGTAAAPGQALLLEWMDREGMCPDWLRGYDFSQLDISKASQEFWNQLSDVLASFFITKTKGELFEWARENVLFLAPVSNARDLLQNPQLEDRGFWVKLEHPELNTAITYPGPFAKLSEAPLRVRKRPPLIGEHNREIYGEIGLSQEKLIILKQAGVI